MVSLAILLIILLKFTHISTRNPVVSLAINKVIMPTYCLLCIYGHVNLSVATGVYRICKVSKNFNQFYEGIMTMDAFTTYYNHKTFVKGVSIRVIQFKNGAICKLLYFVSYCLNKCAITELCQIACVHNQPSIQFVES